MAQSAVIREEFTYAGHNAVINAVCYNRLQDCFVSCDDASLRLWQPTKPLSDLRVVALPPRTSHFLQALTFVEPRQLYVAAALDGTLKLYDQELNQIASVFAGRSAVLSLVFDSKHSRLFSGGVDGCAAWDVRGKPLVGVEAVLNPLYDFAAAPGFFHYASVPSTPASSRVVPPVEPRASFVGVLPAVTTLAVPTGPTAHKKRAVRAHELAWVQSVRLHSDQTRLYAQGKHRIDVFSTADGRHLDAFTDVVPAENGAITAFVVHEKTQYLVCGCVNGYLVVLSVHPTSVVHVFKDHTMAVTGLAVHGSSQLILSSSLDGTVRLWDLEARRQAHRLDIRQPVFALALLSPNATPCRFYCRTRSTVHLFTIQSAAKEHLSSLSPISVLQRVLFPTARTVPCHDTAIPGERHSSTRRVALVTLPTTDEASATDANGNGDDDGAAATSTRQWIVAAGTDRTIRLFSGRAANEAPSFTWIPEEHALDVSGLSLHAAGSKLFILLESQKLLIVDIRKNKKKQQQHMKKTKSLHSAVDEDDGDDDETEHDEEERPTPHRLIDMDAAPLSLLGAARGGGHAGGMPSTKKSVAALAAVVGGTDSPPMPAAHQSSSGGSPNIAANPALRGAVRSLCCCYYPPIFRAAAPTAGASVVGGSDAAAQLKWFSRTFVNRRQQSKRDLKKLGELSTTATPSAGATSPARDGVTAATPLLQSDREWVVCGTEFGHLVFWHSGLTNSFQEAISLDAHDASVVAIAASASSPLCVSLDASRRVHVWQFQPVFTLRQMVELNDAPSCFVLAPTCELLLTGYDDGAVVFMNVSDALDRVETLPGSNDAAHDAMVSGADFLDAKMIVLTASVDAVVKIWDQQKNLLRQIQIAMALTCLCFMNDDGDVMAGVPTGILMLSKDDLLPDKLPVHARNDASASPASRAAKPLPFWLGGDDAATAGATTESASPPKATAMAVSSTTGPKGRFVFQKKPAVTFDESSLPPDAAASPPEHDDARTLTDRVETDDATAPSLASARKPVPWKRRSFHESLSLLMGSTGNVNSQPTPLQALHPPVLRPLTNQQPQPQPPPSTTRPPSSRSLFSGKDPDWREVIMPSSPRHVHANPFAQRNRRLKPPSASAAIIAELKALAHASPPPLSPRGARTTRDHDDPLPLKSDTEPLGIGRTEPTAPLQYCKHQAPVLPKAKTPRKLWNAIGGEDRRLIAVQRNLPSLS